MLQSVASLGGATLLAGCGFHPVYMPTASGGPGPAERDMAAIQVGLIPDRPGQLLRQALQQRLGSDSGAEAPRYKLAVSYAIEGQGVAVAPDSTPTFTRLIGRAHWSLTSVVPPHAPVTSGLARAYASMDVFQQQYFAADLETEQQQRVLARELAAQIAEQLAVFFRRRAGMS
ncbi:MAG TPA: LPS assembly lipoprotein LptE [Acetobacteraceae bacterium]|nr:LPS assembly lipoprotein LptE [Acetobacteraceae bacterium]